jgi:cytochrome c oxidase subunit 2
LKPSACIPGVAASALVAFAAGCNNAPMNTLVPESDLASWITSLYWETVGWLSVILIIVIVLIILVLAKYSTRRTADNLREPPVHLDEHLMLELGWTGGPAFILLLTAIPAVVITFRELPDKYPADALRVEVYAHQWWWEFHYPSLGVNTANEPHLPVNRPVVFELRTDDVIHSFWIPRLGGKSDVIPNHVNRLFLTPFKTGEYYGECAEFCGLSHANMRMRVFVDTKTQFDRWVAGQTGAAHETGLTHTAEAAAGLRVYAGSPCGACHTITGVSTGTTAPNLSHLASRTTIAGGTLPNTPEELAAWIEHPELLKPGAKMPSLALSPVQLSDLVSYLGTLH